MTVEMSDDRILKEVRDKLDQGVSPIRVIIERHRDSSMEELLASLPEGATGNTDEYVFFSGDTETIRTLEDNTHIFHVWSDVPISPFGG